MVDEMAQSQHGLKEAEAGKKAEPLLGSGGFGARDPGW